MACACKVNQQLSYLQKHYGTNKEQEGSRKTDIRTQMIILGKKIISGFFVLLFLPLFLISILIKALFKKNKVIKLDKFVTFGHGRHK